MPRSVPRSPSSCSASATRLDPFALARRIEQQLERIYAIATRRPSAPPTPAAPVSRRVRHRFSINAVVAIVGDGSSLYSIQALWSAAEYNVGALFVVLSNGGYAIMDRLAEIHGGSGPWPAVNVDVSALARAFGCAAQKVETHEELVASLDEVVPGLGTRTEPLVLEVVVAPDETFAP